MSENIRKLMKSYTQGMAKSMDFNHKIKVMKREYSSDIYSAWQDVGLELNQVMESYSKKESTVFNAR